MQNTIKKSLLSLFLFSIATASVGCAQKKFESGSLPDEVVDEGDVPVIDRPDPSKESAPAPSGFVDNEASMSSKQKSAILAKYDYLDPKHLIATKLLASAVIYFDQNLSRIKNKNYLTVIDFSLPSTKRRFYVISMKTGDVWSTTMAHGKGSDTNNDTFAERFSNVSGSNASSLGAYLTAETYIGSHGLSLRLDGLSTTNSNARSRAIVVHGASYVVDKEVRQGRSWGCPAVPMNYKDKVISWLKGGSVIYAQRSLK